MNEIRQPQKRTSIEKKQRIIKAGLKLFCEKGYYNTTTVEIAKIAGVSTGIVYNYFKDKKDILLQALEFSFNNIFTPINNFLQEIKPKFDFNKSIRLFIEICVQAHYDNKFAHKELMGMCLLDADANNLYQRLETKIIQALCEYFLSNGINALNLTDKMQFFYSVIKNYCHNAINNEYSENSLSILMDEIIKFANVLFLQ